MNISAFFQIIAFLASHKEDIKSLILNIEALMPEAIGADKAQTVKDFIGKALGLEAQIESVWSYVAPIFNHFVATTKAP